MGTLDDWFWADGNNWSSYLASGTGDVAFTNLLGVTSYEWGAAFQGSEYGLIGANGNFLGQVFAPPTDGYSEYAGVIGVSPQAPGVAGLSTFAPGVYGHEGVPNEDISSMPNGLACGVLGTSINLSGVIGWSTNWYGVEARTIDGEAAVLADAQNGLGVWAFSSTRSGVYGTTGNYGPSIPSFTNIAGVFGTSDALSGVIGTSNKSAGVFGFSNSFGVAGQATSPGSYAGFFNGNVFVIGNLTVSGAKSAAVPFPDGTQRVLYCMESPELWFEDFGSAKLKRGRAGVPLDTDFAKVVKRGDYRVFLTAEGDCRGLYVRRKSAAGFEVRELMGGKSSIDFSYRIVGRRKDIERHRRFAKIDTPELPPAAAVVARKPASATSVRSFVAKVEKEARRLRPKLAKKGKRSGPLPNYLKLAPRMARLSPRQREAGKK